MTNSIIVVLKITPMELAGYTYHLQGFYLRLWGQTFRPVPYHVMSTTLSPYYLQISFSLFKHCIVLFRKLPLQSQERWKVNFQDFDFNNFLRVGGWSLMPPDPLGTHIFVIALIF